MRYTTENLRKIQHVREVFGEFIRKSEHIDVVYSDKVGYIILSLKNANTLNGFEPEEIISAEHLCLRLLDEIIDNYQDKRGQYKERTAFTQTEKHEILQQMSIYMEQLPEYWYLQSKALCGCSINQVLKDAEKIK